MSAVAACRDGGGVVDIGELKVVFGGLIMTTLGVRGNDGLGETNVCGAGILPIPHVVGVMRVNARGEPVIGGIPGEVR